MGLERMIKREIGITLATVLLVTTVFTAFSYALFKVEETGETNVITFGNISMSFCADATCNTTISNIGNVIGTETVDGVTSYVPIYPQEDPTTTEEWAELAPYTFTLTNDGDIDLYLSIYLEKDTTAGLSYTVDGNTYSESVDDDQIKIAIGESGSTPTIMLYSDTENTDGDHVIANNILLTSGTTKTFHLYAWLKSTATNASQGKYFVTQISARGEYLPEE